jgi:hypothetical protein
VARVAEPRDLTDLGEKRGGRDQSDAGDGHQAPGCLGVDREAGELLLERVDLLVEEVDLAQRGVDRVALILG